MAELPERLTGGTTARHARRVRPADRSVPEGARAPGEAQICSRAGPNDCSRAWLCRARGARLGTVPPPEAGSNTCSSWRHLRAAEPGVSGSQSAPGRRCGPRRTKFGLHVARAARSVGEAGLVIGVEPQPAALLRTRLNLALNGLLSNVKLIQGALGRAEQMTFMPWSIRRTPRAASLIDRGPGFHVQRSAARVVYSRSYGVGVCASYCWMFRATRATLAGVNLADGPELAVIERIRSF